MAHPRHRHPGAPRIRSAGDPGLIHVRAGRLAVQSVIVAGGGDAVAQQSGMIGEEAIGLNDVSAGLGAGNMLRISSGTASNAALQTICPM